MARDRFYVRMEEDGSRTFLRAEFKSFDLGANVGSFRTKAGALYFVANPDCKNAKEAYAAVKEIKHPTGI